MGPGNSRYIDFSLCSPGICPALRGHSHCESPAKSPVQIPAGKCEITSAGLDIKSEAWSFHSTAGMMLRPKLGI